MNTKKTMNLDEFKEMVSNEQEERDKIIGRTDFIDLDNGVMRIYPEHLGKYLEKYGCKDEEDLKDTLWYGYGIFCQIKY